MDIKFCAAYNVQGGDPPKPYGGRSMDAGMWRPSLEMDKVATLVKKQQKRRQQEASDIHPDVVVITSNAEALRDAGVLDKSIVEADNPSHEEKERAIVLTDDNARDFWQDVYSFKEAGLFKAFLNGLADKAVQIFTGDDKPNLLL